METPARSRPFKNKKLPTMSSPYREAAVVEKPRAKSAGFFRRWKAKRRGVFVKMEIRKERASVTRRYPCASWKARQALAINDVMHPSGPFVSFFLQRKCLQEHQANALAWARRDFDGLVAYYKKICAEVKPPVPGASEASKKASKK